MDDIKQEIKLINSIIEEAVIHGGDPGGPYFSNYDALKKAIMNWLDFKNINNQDLLINREFISKNFYNLPTDIRNNTRYCKIIDKDEIDKIENKLIR